MDQEDVIAGLKEVIGMLDYDIAKHLDRVGTPDAEDPDDTFGWEFYAKLFLDTVKGEFS